jgi:hypothetical protein
VEVLVGAAAGFAAAVEVLVGAAAGFAAAVEVLVGAFPACAVDCASALSTSTGTAIARRKRRRAKYFVGELQNTNLPVTEKLQ